MAQPDAQEPPAITLWRSLLALSANTDPSIFDMLNKARDRRHPSDSTPSQVESPNNLAPLRDRLGHARDAVGLAKAACLQGGAAVLGEERAVEMGMLLDDAETLIQTTGWALSQPAIVFDVEGLTHMTAASKRLAAELKVRMELAHAKRGTQNAGLPEPMQEHAQPSLWISPKEASKRAGVATSTIKRWAEKHWIISNENGYIDEPDLEKKLEDGTLPKRRSTGRKRA